MNQDFATALRSARNPVIGEIKKTNGNGESLIGGSTIPELVKRYHEAGAPCLSVVTGRWFGGSSEMLREVTDLTELPVLQKDFITRRTQVDDAVTHGAAAVLLTAGLLPISALGKLIDHALDCGLLPFVEITSHRELAAVPRPMECAIAVNNKDIRTRERRPPALERSLLLTDAVAATGTRCAVSASGIDSPEEAARLLTAGYDGVLVATALLADGDLAAWFGPSSVLCGCLSGLS